MRRLTIAAALVLAACGKDGGSGGSDEHDRYGRYMKRTKPTEAELQLDRIGTLAQKYFYSHDNAFPAIKLGPTPATPCCELPDRRCEPSLADWTGNGWEQLHFAMIDNKFHFQYSFESDGKTFTATATADLDCDPVGGVTTYTMKGTVVHGEPTYSIERTSEE
jgi:hypothetical protein